MSSFVYRVLSIYLFLLRWSKSKRFAAQLNLGSWETVGRVSLPRCLLEVVSLVGELLTKPQDVESSIWEHVWLSPIEVLDLKNNLTPRKRQWKMNTETTQIIDFNELCSRKFQDHLQSATAAVNEPDRGAWKMKSFWKWGLSDPSSSYPPLRDPEWNHMKLWASEMELQFNRHVEPDNLFWSAPSLGKRNWLEVWTESRITSNSLIFGPFRMQIGAATVLVGLVLDSIRLVRWTPSKTTRGNCATRKQWTSQPLPLCQSNSSTESIWQCGSEWWVKVKVNINCNFFILKALF